MEEAYFITIKLLDEEHPRMFKDCNIGMLNENDGLFAIMDTQGIPMLVVPVHNVGYCKLEPIDEYTH